MKAYRSTRELLSEVESRLSTNRPSFHHSPLEDVAELLASGRRYSWVGIYLAVGDNSNQRLLGAGGGPHPAQVAGPNTRSKLLISIKLGGHELGVLDVESERENAFGSEDRVLLENVANELARFLSGPGKYLVRQARNSMAHSNAAKA